MAIKSYFFNAVESGGVYDRVYNAEDFTSYLGSLVKNGVLADPSTSLQVMADTGMTLKVKPGECWIQGHKMVLDADYIINLPAASSTLPRRDAIVLRLDMTNRLMTISVKKGTASSLPVVPVPTRESDVWELFVAFVDVNANTSNITQANITDLRSDNDYCGWVTGLIDQVDTSTLFNQYETAYNQALQRLNTTNATFLTLMNSYIETIQAGWDAWFSTLTEQLTVATYIQKFKKTEVASWGAEDPHEVTLDMAGYAYDSADVIFVFINGLKAVEGIDYSLFVGSQVKVRINTLGSTSGQDQTINIMVLKSKIGFNTLVTEDDDPIVTENDDNLVV